MSGRRMAGIALVALTLVASTAIATAGQATAPPATTLASRLPATIDGSPVQVVASEDLGTWIDEVFAGEPHPEIDALEAALAAQGLTLDDVGTVTADFEAAHFGSIQGFQIPGADAAALQDPISAAYLIGLGELERTEREVGDRSVTFLSEGPLDTASYPFAVLPDSDVLWIVTAETSDIIDAVEALLAVAAGTAPGNTSTAPPPPAAIGPATWFGTMSGTTTWNKGKYVGETSATFRGTLERIDDEGAGYCLVSPCAAYRPMGEIAWTFESSAPGPPSCDSRTSGSVSTGDVVTPQDQMVFMEPIAPEHLGYWGTGAVSVPAQACAGWEGISTPGMFFEIPPPEEEHLFADVTTELRPGCAAVDWRIERDATELKGTCWRYDEAGYEQRFEWDLRDVDPEQP